MKLTITGLPDTATLSDINRLVGEIGALTAQMPRPGTVVITGADAATVQRGAAAIIGTYPGAHVS